MVSHMKPKRAEVRPKFGKPGQSRPNKTNSVVGLRPKCKTQKVEHKNLSKKVSLLSSMIEIDTRLDAATFSALAEEGGCKPVDLRARLNSGAATSSGLEGQPKHASAQPRTASAPYVHALDSKNQPPNQVLGSMAASELSSSQSQKDDQAAGMSLDGREAPYDAPQSSEKPAASADSWWKWTKGLLTYTTHRVSKNQWWKWTKGLLTYTTHRVSQDQWWNWIKPLWNATPRIPYDKCWNLIKPLWNATPRIADDKPTEPSALAAEGSQNDGNQKGVTEWWNWSEALRHYAPETRPEDKPTELTALGAEGNQKKGSQKVASDAVARSGERPHEAIPWWNWSEALRPYAAQQRPEDKVSEESEQSQEVNQSSPSQCLESQTPADSDHSVGGCCFPLIRFIQKSKKGKSNPKVADVVTLDTVSERDQSVLDQAPASQSEAKTKSRGKALKRLFKRRKTSSSSAEKQGKDEAAEVREQPPQRACGARGQVMNWLMRHRRPTRQGSLQPDAATTAPSCSYPSLPPPPSAITSHAGSSHTTTE